MALLKSAQHMIKHTEYGWAEFFSQQLELIEKVQEVIDRDDGTFYPKPKTFFAIYNEFPRRR